MQGNLTKQSLKQQRIEKRNLFSTCAVAGGKIYAFTSFARLPIKVDLCTGKIRLIEEIEGYSTSFYADTMLNAGDSIFILELNGNGLLQYNINKSACRYFDIGCHGEDWDNYVVFAQYEKYLYIVPRYVDMLVKINVESGEVQKGRKLHSTRNTYKIDRKQEKKSYFWFGCQYEEKLWLFQKQSNLLVMYDMCKDTWKEYELSVEINDCVHAVQYNENLYILSSEGRIYCWNILSETTELLAVLNEGRTDNAIFSRLAVTDKKIFVLPSLGEKMYVVHLNTRKIEEYKAYPKDFRYCGQKEWSKYYGYCEDKELYYFAMRSANYMLCVSKCDGKESWIKLEFDIQDGDYLRVFQGYNNTAVLREDEWTLKELTDVNKYKFYMFRDDNKLGIGKQVWSRLWN